MEEKQRKIKNDVLAFARRYFSLSEVEHLSAISDSEVQRQEFIKLWTLKVRMVLEVETPCIVGIFGLLFCGKKPA